MEKIISKIKKLPRALVTGANAGIGKAIAEKFLAEGYAVVGIDLNSSSNTFPIFACDLNNPEEINETYSRIVEKYGTPAILVNNAGIYKGLSWQEETLAQFEEVININVRAPFQLTQLFGNSLIKENSPAAIINISSISSRSGSLDPAYSASKAAVDGLTRSFATALAKNGIRVNSVALGPVNTELAINIPDERKQHYFDKILLSRFGEPNEIANLVYFLASEQASFITGEVYYACGGII